MADKGALDLPAEFDRLLKQELSVEPSPAFAAQIRARAAEQHRTPWWRARWIPAIGSFATVASIVTALIVPAIARWTSVPPPPGAPAVRIEAVRRPVLEPLIEPERPVMAAHLLRREPTDPSGVPEVIVDSRQRTALSTLFRMMEQGRVSGNSFATTVPVSLEPIVDHMGDITVSPVVVSAMPPRGVLHNNER